MKTFNKTLLGFMIGKYPKTSQILQGVAVSSLERAVGYDAPAQLSWTYGLVKGLFNYYSNKIGAGDMPTLKKLSLYTLGTALPYADKIYCALAPYVQDMMR